MLNKDEVQPAKYAEELCEELVRVFEHCEGVKFNNRYIVISVENGKIASCSAYKGEIKLESMGEPDMKNKNDWHEKGELPPVGEIVELLWGGVSQCTVEIISYRNNKNTVVFWRMDNDHADSAETPTVTFRPLPTETDKLVDEMMFHGCQSLNRKQATELVEQGYRKIKPMNRDEVISKMYGMTDNLSMVDAAILYDAGWRPTDVEGE